MELSEEEKKAIELLRNKNTEYYYRFIDVRDAVSTLLNLIDKQQKEIEELKQNRDEYKEEYKKLLNARYYDYISKDKIKEKINELETLYNCNLDTALTSYEMFHFVRSYVDKVKNILNELLEDK